MSTMIRTSQSSCNPFIRKIVIVAVVFSVCTALQVAFFEPSGQAQDLTGTAITTSQLADITPQVLVSTTGFIYSRASKLYTGTMTVTNPGTNPIAGPIAVSLNNLASGVTLSNAGGQYNGFPYVYQNLSLSPGASISFPMQFSNPSNARIDFSALIYQVGPNAYLTTATPYQPQQSTASYETAPAGFTPVFTEAVVRHGSRGLSSFDGTVYNMYIKAAADGALTPLGVQLGPDVMAMMKANALLDVGIAGITAPGYGNLSQTGIMEEQQIAARLLQRLPSQFAQLPAGNRKIVMVNSGVNRAADSAGFFAQSLATNNPSLGPLIVKSAPLTAYPSNKPVAQAAGVNRFLLYFHKLAAKTDLVSSLSDPYYQTYQDSLTYQAYLKNANMVTKVNSILTAPDATANARNVLEGLFTQDFVDKIASGTYTFANAGSYTFTSDDGGYSTTVSGDGSTTVQSLSDAANELYSLYAIAPAMQHELNGIDFSKYISPAQASYLSYLDDVQSFYQKGPGIAEDGFSTFKMAQVLLDDLFNEVDAISRGDFSHGAKLRFTHGEEIMPLASILGLKNIFVQVPNAGNYSYDNNPWRGAIVSPLAANVQWDVYSNGAGTLLVKMLYNEKETDFKADCDQARYAPGSHYYNYSGLKACYNHASL